MLHKYTKLINGASVGSLTSIALLLVLSNFYLYNSLGEKMHSAAPDARTGSVAECMTDCESLTGSSALLQDAKDLQSTLAASGGMVPSLGTLIHALENRHTLLQRSVKVIISDSNNPDAPEESWTVSLADYPELVTLNVQWSSANYEIDKGILSSYIAKGTFAGEHVLTSATVSGTWQDGKVLRADKTAVARDGYDYKAEALSRLLAHAFQNGDDTVHVDAPFTRATVRLAIDGKDVELSLLASGRSDFSNSPEERVWNVNKAINERVNNILVKPGEVFSFVDTLGGPVTLQKGWREGMGLFGGGAALTPGAGICQAATTVFRAALLAGFPIVEKRNHSMWVDHYEPYGAGLDATIFPGVHDMRFRNDTGEYILIQAFIHDIDDVTVQIYGIPDNRTVSLDGPYFYNTKPRADDLKPIGKDQVGWVRTVTYANGMKEVKPLVATYHKGIPRFVFSKYAGTPGTTLLQALVSESGSLVVATGY